jgi:hypothetical protein
VQVPEEIPAELKRANATCCSVARVGGPGVTAFGRWVGRRNGPHHTQAVGASVVAGARRARGWQSGRGNAVTINDKKERDRDAFSRSSIDGDNKPTSGDDRETFGRVPAAARLFFISNRLEL